MGGGHCQGSSVASLLLFAKCSGQPSDYGPATTFALDKTTPVQRFIAYGFVYQALELYTLGIYKSPGKTGGHAITPFAVEKRPDGKFGILVYDKQHPDDENDTVDYDGQGDPQVDDTSDPNAGAEDSGDGPVDSGD